MIQLTQQPDPNGQKRIFFFHIVLAFRRSWKNVTTNSTKVFLDTYILSSVKILNTHQITHWPDCQVHSIFGVLGSHWHLSCPHLKWSLLPPTWQYSSSTSHSISLNTFYNIFPQPDVTTIISSKGVIPLSLKTQTTCGFSFFQSFSLHIFICSLVPLLEVSTQNSLSPTHPFIHPELPFLAVLPHFYLPHYNAENFSSSQINQTQKSGASVSPDFSWARSLLPLVQIMGLIHLQYPLLSHPAPTQSL
jgi:hypothetical protein